MITLCNITTPMKPVSVNSVFGFTLDANTHSTVPVCHHGLAFLQMLHFSLFSCHHADWSDKAGILGKISASPLVTLHKWCVTCWNQDNVVSKRGEVSRLMKSCRRPAVKPATVTKSCRWNHRAGVHINLTSSIKTPPLCLANVNRYSSCSSVMFLTEQPETLTLPTSNQMNPDWRFSQKTITYVI